MTAPLVSVVIPTVDRPDGLAVALASVAAQLHPAVETVVVCDGGPDVSGRLEGLRPDFGWKYVHLAENRGRSAARNQGAQAASGRYLAWLDDDDRFYPNHLKTLAAAVADGTRVAYTDARRVIQRRLPSGEYVVKRTDLPYSVDFSLDRLLLGNYIPILCLLLERELFLEVGGFDESLHTHEDWDLWLRLARRLDPEPFRHVPRVTAEYVWRTDGTTTSSAKQADFLATRELIYRRCADLTAQRPDLRARQEDILAAERQGSELIRK